MKPQNQMFKILILGDSAVGKSCLLLQYCDKKFQQSHVATVGIDFKMKQLNLDENNVVKMQLWDTAGQERFQTLASTLYKGAMGIALVYSVDNVKAFQGIQRWVKQIQENSQESIQIVLIANKSDLPTKAVSTADGKKLAEQFNLPFFEVSAMTGENVQEAFEMLARNIFAQIKSKPQPKEEPAQASQKLTVAAATSQPANKSSKPCACS